MARTVREVIKDLTREHLISRGGKCFGQCLTAVGWVGGTLPELYESDGMVELSMADVAGGAIVTGAALAGCRPIYVVRYQGFQWYNLASIVNYAAKSKELWGRSCPLFVRSIAMEGGIGPVAGSSHHSLAYRMPGIKIAAPMTASEYESVYAKFMQDDDPYYVSEHRKSYDFSSDLYDVANESPDFVIFPVSVTRFEMEKLMVIAAAANLQLAVYHQVWLKPFIVRADWVQALRRSRLGGLVLDDDYAAGVASSLATVLSSESGKVVRALGLEDRTAGFHPAVDNLPPTAEKILNTLLFIKDRHGGGN